MKLTMSYYHWQTCCFLLAQSALSAFPAVSKQFLFPPSLPALTVEQPQVFQNSKLKASDCEVQKSQKCSMVLEARYRNQGYQVAYQLLNCAECPNYLWKKFLEDFPIAASIKAISEKIDFRLVNNSSLGISTQHPYQIHGNFLYMVNRSTTLCSPPHLNQPQKTRKRPIPSIKLPQYHDFFFLLKSVIFQIQNHRNIQTGKDAQDHQVPLKHICFAFMFTVGHQEVKKRLFTNKQ